MIVGNGAGLHNTRYVITLDADTGLPAGAALALVATAAHPLNQPIHDAETNVVISGYGMLQPRMEPRRAASDPPTRYQALAMDPKSPAEAPVLADAQHRLFAGGAFYGKGLYDVLAVDRALRSRLPNDWVLSHDLLEGCFARCGSCPDITLTETLPSTAVTDSKRRHRWIRGDWQSAPWALPIAPTKTGLWQRNPLPWLARWRVFENIRRAMWPIACFSLLFLLSCLDPAAGVGVWGLLALIYLVPLALTNLYWLTQRAATVSLAVHLAFALRCFTLHAGRALIAMALLPSDAVLAVRAGCKAVWRMCRGGRQALEWTASDRAEREATAGIAGHIRAMLAGPSAAAVLIGYGAASSARGSGLLAVLWAASPLLAWWLSRPSASDTQCHAGAVADPPDEGTL